MAEQADAPHSKRGARKGVGVQVPPMVPMKDELDPKERAAEKQAERDEDERLIAEDKMTVQEVNAKNFAFGWLFKNGKPQFVLGKPKKLI